MNFFDRKTTWSNKEFIPFKLCIASIYIVIGSFFHAFFENYYVPLLILFWICTLWTVILWLKKMKGRG